MPEVAQASPPRSYASVNTETVWPGASGNTEMFISDNTGHYSDASVGRTLF